MGDNKHGPDKKLRVNASISSRKSIALGLLFSADEAAAKSFLDRCAAEGLTGILVRTSYEVHMPAKLAGVTVRQPMDYLSPEACDALHEEVLAWQEKLPSVRLASGARLADWSAGDSHPASLWAWIATLAPYVQVTMRAVRLFSAIADQEKPAAFDCLGVSGDLAWLAPLAVKVFGRASVEPRFWGQPPVRPARILPWPRLRTPKIDYRPVRRRASYLRVIAALEAHDRKTRSLGLDGFKGHAVLIMRGAKGVEWMVSPQTGRLAFLDEYSEGMPEALARACRDRRWRLTIIYEGPKPIAVGYRSLAETYPSFISELAGPTFSGLAAQLRVPAREQYEPAVARLVADRAFRKAFVFDGVDMFDQFSDYLARSILNLSVLMTTQSETWEKTFGILKPNLVLGGRLEAKPWINVAASRTGARTVSIKLGIGDEMTPSILARRPDGSHETESQPDALAVWGEHQVEHLRRRAPAYGGVIKALGRTRSDTFVRAANALDQARIREKLGLAPSGPVIVWAATCRTRWGLWPNQTAGSAVLSPDSWETAFKALIKLAVRRDAQIVVRPHPVDDMAFITDQIKRHGKGRAVFSAGRQGTPNVELLAVSDILVSGVSSMFAEAVLSNCVAVNLWSPEISLIYETARFDHYSEISEPVRSAREMEQRIGALLDSPDQYAAALERARANLPRFFGGTEGNNATNTAIWALETTPITASQPEEVETVSTGTAIAKALA
ncbi:MAG: hypothetical protein EON91_03370 [Brevundimonas sp.]|uniref:hypothetical protein n=1 Tax=Brevundimonas sp. TaxID=1871086 RepID=UPI0011F9D9CF|nr:hypothetical protein [Brevundimonas sp.]RZJ18936.1 MAG: hypothetical protein EON91_03370 [Brevundimonas sp.]